MKIFIEPNSSFFKIVKYTTELIFLNKEIPVIFVDDYNDADLTIGDSEDFDIQICIEFYQRLESEIYDHKIHFDKSYILKNQNDDNDYISTIFYLTNCIQEYNYPIENLDHYGRFPYDDSLQKKFDIVERNIVQELIDELFLNNRVLSKLNLTKKKSTVLLSQDIDFTNHANKEIKYSISKWNIIDAFKFFILKLRKSSHWLPIQKIVSIQKKYGFDSIYFWIVNHGKDELGIVNGDYKFSDVLIQEKVKSVENAGHKNGLHKSTLNSSFDSELQNISTSYNRYHYLKFNIPKAWEELDDSQLKFDFSLGWGSAMGFRNSYGRPFSPYNFKTRKAYNFTIYPLHIMDSTFMYYQTSSIENIKSNILSFLTAHQYDSVLSILFHNSSFTEGYFKDWFNLYKSILKHLNILEFKSEEI